MTTPTTSEEELAIWARAPVESDLMTGGAGILVETAKAIEKTPPSRTSLIQIVLVGSSLPLGCIGLFISTALYIPPLHRALAANYLGLYGIYPAILATLVLFLAVTFPRVQASLHLSIVFGTLFVLAFAYFAAVLSVIVNSAAGFIIAVVQFLGCWELLVLSLAGVDLEGPIVGKAATYASYTINLAIIVALRPPSRLPITDAAIAAVVVLTIAWFFLIELYKLVDRLQGDSPN